MRSLKITILGMGTVGTGVARLLTEQRDYLRDQAGVEFQVKWVVVRDLRKTRQIRLPDAKWTTDALPAITDPEVDIVVEVMGGMTPACDWLIKSLEAGKDVVTANKAVLAERGLEVFEAARRSGKSVVFEAAVAGGVPIIAALSQCLAPNRIRSLSGIVNGTCNYILTAMHDRGVGYDVALKEAQEKGFAEADPTMDVDGTDTVQKLAILARLAFHLHVHPSQIRRQGIEQVRAEDIKYVSELGYVIKLLALANVIDRKLMLAVAPSLVHENRPIAKIAGEYNAIEVIGDAVGETFFVGKGAGMMPTASSVVAGLVDLAVGRAQPTFGALRLWEQATGGPPYVAAPFVESKFYLRFMIEDRPGTLAKIANVLGEHGISISSVIQHETGERAIGAPVPLIIMTHHADGGAVERALAKTEQMDFVRQPTVCLHVAE